MRCPWLSLSFFACALAAPLAAEAQAIPPIHVRYDAPEDCPAAGAFVAQLQARTARARVAEEGQTGLDLRVAVERAGQRFHGTLFVADASGDESRRDVSGDSCKAVISALALVAALRIDPSASTSASPTEAPAPEAPDATPSTTFAPSPVSVPSDAHTPLPTLESTRPRRSPSSLPARSPWRIHFAGAFGLDVLGFVTSGATLGASVLGEVALDNPGILAPEIRVGASRSESRFLAAADGSGTGGFTWSRALLEVCPLRFELAPTLDVRPCITSAAGGLHAVGHGVGTSEPPETSVWGEIGGAALLEWRIVGSLRLQGEGGLSLPLSRPTFYFARPGAGETDLYPVPAIAGEARLGLAIRFL